MVRTDINQLSIQPLKASSLYGFEKSQEIQIMSFLEGVGSAYPLNYCNKSLVRSQRS